MSDKVRDTKVVMAPIGGATKLRTCTSSFNLERHLLPFMQKSPFYATLSRYMSKRFTVDIPTAAVGFDPKADELIMYINPAFVGGGTYTTQEGKQVTCEPLSDAQIHGLLTHEFNHPVFGHLSSRTRSPAKTWNIATDLAINSLYMNFTAKSDDPLSRALPKMGLIPGQRPYIDPAVFDTLDDEAKQRTMQLCDIIEAFEPMQSSEWYFRKLIEKCPEMGDEGDTVIAIGPLDDHSNWGDVPDDMLEYVESKVKAIVERAVKEADNKADGWGNIPAELRVEIRRSVSNIIDWRNVLRQFVGNIVRGERSTSIKRINRRYPYIHPGMKRGYTRKLFVGIDESGSVSDEMLEMFFNELDSLTRKTDITLCHFDCHAGPKDLYEWKKGMRPKLERVKGGGTDFNAPTAIVNDPANRGRWDGMLLCTDGCAPKPIGSRIKRGWVLGQGCSLLWPENEEIQIHLSKDRPMSGAWR